MDRRALAGRVRRAATGLVHVVVDRLARPLALADEGPLLVLAPHPDDETFGCGGVIAAARRRGVAVTVVCVSDGRRSVTSKRLTPDDIAALRAAELNLAADRLGVAERDLVTLDHRDGDLSTLVDTLTAQFVDLVGRHRPAVVLSTFPDDPHPDHAAVGLAAVRAMTQVSPMTEVRTGGPGHEATARPARLFFYAIWQWQERGLWIRPRRGPGIGTRPLLLTRAVRTPLAEPDRLAKRAATSAYESQLRNYTGEATWTVLSPDFLAHFDRSGEVFWPAFDSTSS